TQSRFELRTADVLATQRDVVKRCGRHLLQHDRDKFPYLLVGPLYRQGHAVTTEAQTFHALKFVLARCEPDARFFCGVVDLAEPQRCTVGAREVTVEAG